MSSARVTLAIGASLALHGALIVTLQALPGALTLATVIDEGYGAPVLHAGLRALTPAAEPLTAAHRSSRPGPRAMTASGAKERPEGAVAETKLGLGPVYYAAHLLDERPQVRTHVAPRFPDFVPTPGGRVVLHLYINEQGTVDEVVVTESEPAGLFEAAAVQAFGAAGFTPGRKGGIAVKSRIVIEVTFGEPVPVGLAAAINGVQHE